MEPGPPSSPPGRPPGALAGVRSLWPQYAASAVVFLLYISYYLASHIHTDMYENTPHWPRLEETEAMLLSSSIAGLLSFPIFAFLFEKLNRKVCAYITSAVFIVTCILHKTANTHFLFHVAHCLSAIGITAATFMCTIYVSEIAQDNIRGSLLVGGELLYRANHAAVVIIEEFIYRITFSWFAIVPPVAVILCFAFWLPESPIYFLRRGNRDGATRSLLWLRRESAPESVAKEVEDLEEVLKATRSDAVSTSNIFQQLFNRRTLHYSGIALVLYLTAQFSGDLPTTWAMTVLSTRLGRDFYDIVYTLAQVAYVAGTFVAFFHCDKKGRRTLLFSSTVGCSVCLIPIAICLHVMSPEKDMSADKIFAIVFAIAFTFSLSLGIGSVISVVLTDMFPPRILLIHLVIKGILRYTLDYIEEHYIMPNPGQEIVLHPELFWASSAVCGSAALLIFKYLPESMNRPAGFPFMENRNDMLLENM